MSVVADIDTRRAKAGRNRAAFANERVRENLAGWLFVLPALIGFGVFFVYPAIRAILISFTDWNLLRAPRFIGLSNYFHLLRDDKFWQALRVTAIYVVVNVPLQVIIGVGIAVLLDRLTRSVVTRALVILPFLISNVTAAMIFLWLLDPILGIINSMLEALGIPAQPFFTSPDYAIYSIVLVNVWRYSGFTALLFYAGIQAIPRSLYEAARIDGASENTSFWKITLPLLRPVMVFVLVTNIVGSFQIFDTVAVATKGGPANSTNVLLYYIYDNAFSFSRMGYASAMSVALFVGLVIFTLIQLRLMRGGSSDLE
jgi:multiple sugar transport system permease protein